MDLGDGLLRGYGAHLWHVEADLGVAEDDPEEQQSQED